jgi:hypothetical protein
VVETPLASRRLGPSPKLANVPRKDSEHSPVPPMDARTRQLFESGRYLELFDLGTDEAFESRFSEESKRPGSLSYLDYKRARRDREEWRARANKHRDERIAQVEKELAEWRQSDQRFPRVYPQSESELRDALAAGRLREGDRLDFKRQIEAGDRGNRNLAVDLASLAVDGGTILVGVTDARPPALSPFELRGLGERVAQVARQRCDPPLTVRIREIAAESDPRKGYLVIEVPLSAEAPHAVGGVFRGRHGTTNITLSAAEVRRLHLGSLGDNATSSAEADAVRKRRVEVVTVLRDELGRVAGQMQQRQSRNAPPFDRLVDALWRSFSGELRGLVDAEVFRTVASAYDLLATEIELEKEWMTARAPGGGIERVQGTYFANQLRLNDRDLWRLVCDACKAMDAALAAEDAQPGATIFCP